MRFVTMVGLRIYHGSTLVILEFLERDAIKKASTRVIRVCGGKDFFSTKK